MFILQRINVRQNERGLLFRNGDFQQLLAPGRTWIRGLPWRERVERVSVRQAVFQHPDLEVIVRSGALDGEAEVLDLQDHQRALVWIDGRFATVCGPGLHAFWTVFHEVRSEIVDAREIRFEHSALATVLGSAVRSAWLEQVTVDAGQVGLLMADGRHRDTLGPGTYALWRNVARVRVRVEAGVGARGECAPLC